jgi:hypothetical protein
MYKCMCVCVWRVSCKAAHVSAEQESGDLCCRVVSCFMVTAVLNPTLESISCATLLHYSTMGLASKAAGMTAVLLRQPLLV